MFLLLIDSFLIIFITFNMGILAIAGLNKLFRCAIQSDPFGIFLIGLTLSTIYFNVISFWLPVNYLTLIPLAVLGAIVFLKNGQPIRPIRNGILDSFRRTSMELFSGPRTLITLCVLAVLLVYWIIPPSNADGPAYHYLSILWYEKYRVVPGLANLHGRFAYDPASFIVAAAYSFHDPLGQSLYPLNGVITSLFFAWLLTRLFRSIHSKLGLAYFAAIILVYRPLLVNVSSASPDTVLYICLSYSVLSLLERVFSGNTRLSFVMIPSLIISYAFIVKLSSFPALLIIPFIVYLLPEQEQVFSHLLKYFTIILFLYIPWLGRNYIMSGYLVYPLPYPDLFNPDWKVSINEIKFELFYLNNRIPLLYGELAPLYGKGPLWHSKAALVQKFFSWLSFCMRNNTLLDPFVFILGILSPFYWIYHWLSVKNKQMRAFILWLIIYAGAVTCALISSEFRYAFPFLILVLVLSLLTHVLSGHDNKSNGYRLVLIPLFIISTIYYIEKGLTLHSTYKFSLADCWLLPLKDPGYRSGKEGFPYRILQNGVKLYLGDSTHHCINACLPCSVIPYGEIEMRGQRLEQGFRIKQDEIGKLYPFIR